MDCVYEMDARSAMFVFRNFLRLDKQEGVLNFTLRCVGILAHDTIKDFFGRATFCE
jgi:hypothetical protein